MFFLELALVGIAIGVIGHFLLDKILVKFIRRLPAAQQILIIIVLGVLYIGVLLYSLTEIVSITIPAFIWIIMIPGMLFSIPGMFFVFLAVYKIFLGGYSEAANTAEEVVSPIVAGTIGFLLSLARSQETFQLYYDLAIIVNFFMGAIGAMFTMFITGITKSILQKIFP